MVTDHLGTQFVLVMKIVVLTLGFIALALAQEKYDSSADDFDISEVIQNDRLLTAYTKCLLNKGPCTPEVKKVRDKLPEALETRCAKCTEKQKKIAKQLVQELQKKHPDTFKQLQAYYDPDGKYKEAFRDYFS